MITRRRAKKKERSMTSYTNGIVVTIGIFLALPIISIIPLSLSKSHYLNLQGFTLKWYERVFTSEVWGNALLTSIIVAGFSSLLSVFIGLLAADGISRLPKISQERIVRFLLLPLMTPIIILAVAIYLWFSEIHFLDNIYSLIFANTLISFPISTLILLVAITKFSRVHYNLESAAKTMGASHLTILRKIIMPNIKFGLIVAFALSFAISFNESVISQFIADTKVLPLSKKVFEGVQFNINPEIAVISTILIFISIFFTLIVFKLQHVIKSRKENL